MSRLTIWQDNLSEGSSLEENDSPAPNSHSLPIALHLISGHPLGRICFLLSWGALTGNEKMHCLPVQGPITYLSLNRSHIHLISKQQQQEPSHTLMVLIFSSLPLLHLNMRVQYSAWPLADTHSGICRQDRPPGAFKHILSL